MEQEVDRFLKIYSRMDKFLREKFSEDPNIKDIKLFYPSVLITGVIIDGLLIAAPLVLAYFVGYATFFFVVTCVLMALGATTFMYPYSVLNNDKELSDRLLLGKASSLLTYIHYPNMYNVIITLYAAYLLTILLAFGTILSMASIEFFVITGLAFCSVMIANFYSKKKAFDVVKKASDKQNKG